MEWEGQSISASSTSQPTDDYGPFLPVGDHHLCYCDIDDVNIHEYGCEATLLHEFEEIRKKQRKFEVKSKDRKTLKSHEGHVITRFYDKFQRSLVTINGEDCRCIRLLKKTHDDEGDCRLCKKQRKCDICTKEISEKMALWYVMHDFSVQ